MNITVKATKFLPGAAPHWTDDYDCQKVKFAYMETAEKFEKDGLSIPSIAAVLMTILVKEAEEIVGRWCRGFKSEAELFDDEENLSEICVIAQDEIFQKEQSLLGNQGYYENILSHLGFCFIAEDFDPDSEYEDEDWFVMNSPLSGLLTIPDVGFQFSLVKRMEPARETSLRTHWSLEDEECFLREQAYDIGALAGEYFEKLERRTR